MKNPLVNLILLGLLCATSFQTYSQESRIENTVLELQGSLLSITYDIVGTDTLKNVWLDITTSKGIKIEAKSLLGNIGQNISPGKGRRIIWDMKKDGVDLQGEEVNVKVIAKEKNEINITNLNTEIIEEFTSKNQSKRRDIVFLKNGTKITGRLEKRFTTSTYKLVSFDGNILTLKAGEIQKIANNYLYYAITEIYLKNGDIVKGIVEEIIPNDEIKVKSKGGDTYHLNIIDIEKVITN